ncbi:MAG: penicillin-binding transpeptidase domain-containing protein [Solirubrobacteraceae bacterium]
MARTAPVHARPAAHRRSNARLQAVIALAVLAFLIGVIVGGSHGSSTDQNLASRFVSAWAHRDYSTLHSLLDPAAQRTFSTTQLSELYVRADDTATATSMRAVGKPRLDEGGVSVAVQIDTRLFGTVHSSFQLPIAGSGSQAGIAFSDALEFPGLRPGERLHRQTTLPSRASLLARDGSPLASGPATEAGERESPLGAAGSAIVGDVGPIPADRLAQLEAQGVPSDAIVGVSGLELAEDDRLRGTPGGELLADARVIASASPHAATALRTTISPGLQQVAVSALGGQYGGLVALQPSTGEILAVAGIGLEGLQPPGSTFKMVTVTGVLSAGIAHSSTVFPYSTYATLDGVKLSNANGEECGGSLTLAFAVSCNSVFAPLGVKLGANRLVATAESFGFNHNLGLAGAAQSTIPAASEIQGELDLGSTAIGQGRVQASALQMAIVAATIADAGKRPTPTFTAASNASPSTTRVMSASVARTVRRLMIEVVREGTGTAAAITGVTVAGKTGTAELGSPTCASKTPPESQSESSQPQQTSEGCSSDTPNPENTDAWFAAFAPALDPKIVVGVLLVKDGAGGATAAPVARQVIESALQSHL